MNDIQAFVTEHPWIALGIVALGFLFIGAGINEAWIRWLDRRDYQREMQQEEEERHTSGVGTIPVYREEPAESYANWDTYAWNPTQPLQPPVDEWADYKATVRPTQYIRRTLRPDWQTLNQKSVADNYNQQAAAWTADLRAGTDPVVVDAPVSPGGYRARHGQSNIALFAEAYTSYNNKAYRTLNEATGSYPVIEMRELVSA